MKLFNGYLVQLDTNDSKEELKKKCHHHNVTDGLNGDNQTLNDLLQTLGSVDCSQGSQHTEDTKNFQETNSTASKDGDEGDRDNHDVEDVERRSTEGSFVEQESICDELETALNGKNSGEDIIKVCEVLKSIKFILMYWR